MAAASRRLATIVAVLWTSIAFITNFQTRAQLRMGIPLDDTLEAIFGIVLVFAVVWLMGVVGGAVGWWVGRSRDRATLSAAAGVVAFFAAAMGELIVMAPRDLRPALVPKWLVIFIPFLAAGIAARWLAVPAERASLATGSKLRRLSHFLSTHLVLRRPFSLDARGLALGLSSGLLVGGVAWAGLLGSPEALVLTQFVSLRNKPVLTSAGRVEMSRWNNLYGPTAIPTGPDPRDDIIILQLDDAMLGELTAATSEAAVNARLLRMLERWGSGPVILPLSRATLALDAPSPGGKSAGKAAPAATGSDDVHLSGKALSLMNPPLEPRARSREERDRSVLVQALMASDRAVLCLLSPPDRADDWALDKIRPAPSPGALPPRDLAPFLTSGLPLASAEFASFYSPQLPSLAIIDNEGRWALPLLLGAQDWGREHVWPPPSRRLSGTLVLGTETIWLAAPGRLLLNVYGSNSAALFPHVSYSAVLSGKPLYDRSLGRWVPPAQFFPGRTVFLDTLYQPSYETPVGTFRATELLAMATDNVRTTDLLVPPSPGFELLLLLLFGAIAGHLSVGCGPLAAARRVAILLAVYGLSAAWLFVAIGLWLPVIGIGAATAGASLLVVQLVFTADEVEVERERREHAQLEQEVALGRAIQTSLLPSGGLRSGAIEIVSRSEPAREVGGDFYNLFMLSGPSPPPSPDPSRPGLPDQHPEAGEKIGIILGDVSGKGVQGAMYMTVATTLLEARAARDTGPEEVLAAANAHLYPKIRALRMFVTVFYGVLDATTGELAFASAGQVPPALAPADAEPTYLRAQGIPLGALRQPRYQRSAMRLSPGDTLVLASDGFVEARTVRGEALGYDGFLEIVARHARAAPLDCLEAIFRETRRFSGDWEEQDDQTLVVIRFHAPE